MAGLVSLLVFWVLAGACQRHGAGVFLLRSATTTAGGVCSFTSPQPKPGGVWWCVPAPAGGGVPAQPEGVFLPQPEGVFLLQPGGVFLHQPPGGAYLLQPGGGKLPNEKLRGSHLTSTHVR